MKTQEITYLKSMGLQIIINQKSSQNLMFTLQDSDQDEDLKPPSFLQKTHPEQLTRATKILQCCVQFINKDDSVTQGQLTLYEQYIAAQIRGKTYMFQLQLTITFEANLEQKVLKFRDNQRQKQLNILFHSQADFKRFYEQIKKSFFQTDFNSKYQVVRKIGRGKTSLVFQIENKINGVIYAAKYYSNIPSSIQKEIRILRVLQHPNLIYFHQMFIQNGQVYLVMDYEDGGTLLDWINQKAFPTMKEKIKFLVDMLNAFEFLRIMGIVHRDLKPQNILYSKKDGCYKIADFSLAIFEDQPITKLVGTPGYIAPQLFRFVDQQMLSNQYSDVYSLGLIYYQLATKQTYFHGQNVEAVLKKNKKAKSLKKKKYSKQRISDLEYDILRMMIRTQPQNRRLSLDILQSTQLRTMVKEHALSKRSSVLSNGSSKKSNQRKNSSYDEELDENLQQDRLVMQHERCIG